MQYWKTYLSKLLKFAVLSKSVDKDSSEFTNEDWDEISKTYFLGTRSSE
jgi:hypothetical protein